MKPIQIILIDDEPAFIDIFTAALSPYNDQVLIMSGARSVDAGFSLLNKAAILPDMVLIDLEMSKGLGGDGFDGIKIFRDRFPNLKLVQLTTHNAFSLANVAIESGANGYLLKSSPIENIVQYLRIINDGGIMIDPSIIPTPTPSFKQVQLSDEDLRIVHYIMQEMTSLEIAEKMNGARQSGATIDFMYIENRRRKIISKIGCKNVVGLAKYALQNDLFNFKRGERKRNEQRPVNASIVPKFFFIVDDHEVYAQGLSHLLHNYKKYPLKVSAYAKNIEDFLSSIEEQTDPESHALILDYTLPGCDILQAVLDIKTRFPGLLLIISLKDHNLTLEKEMFDAGVSGIIHRKMDAMEMLEKIISVFENQPEKVPHTGTVYNEIDAFDVKIIKHILAEKDSRSIALEVYKDEFQQVSGDDREKLKNKLANKVDIHRSKLLKKTSSVNVIGLVRYAWEKYLF